MSLRTLVTMAASLVRRVPPVYWERTKWFGNICYVISTVSMIDPNVAATSIVPWAAFFVGNVIWALDSCKDENMPWVTLAVFFMCWDVVVIVTRLYDVNHFL